MNFLAQKFTIRNLVNDLTNKSTIITQASRASSMSSLISVHGVHEQFIVHSWVTRSLFNPILPGGGAHCARADFNEL